MDLLYRILTCCSQLLNLGFSCIFLSTALEPELRKSNVNQFQLCGHFAIELEDCIDARGIFFYSGGTPDIGISHLPQGSRCNRCR